MRTDECSAESDLVRAANPAEIFRKLVGQAVVCRADTVSAADVEAVGDGD